MMAEESSKPEASEAADRSKESTRAEVSESGGSEEGKGVQDDEGAGEVKEDRGVRGSKSGGAEESKDEEEEIQPETCPERREKAEKVINMFKKSSMEGGTKGSQLWGKMREKMKDAV